MADPRKAPARSLQEERRHWTNPLSVALPNAPKMRVLCYYGVGKVRAYGTGVSWAPIHTSDPSSPLSPCPPSSQQQPTERAYVYKTDADGRIDVIDTSINDPRRNVSDGVFMGEGDGTVSLLSLGYHCAKVCVYVCMCTHAPARLIRYDWGCWSIVGL